MRPLPLVLSAALVVASLGPAAACAQPAGSAQPAPLDARTRAAVIDSLAGQLQRHYVDADTARRIGDLLRARLRAGAYDSVTYPARFAELVTRDLREVNGDLHLGLRFQPPRGGPPPGGASDAVRQNYGMGKAEILPGNVGYLEISGFLGVEGSDEAVAAAMRMLEHTDAVIIDVRRNGGGSGLMSHLVFSHFLPAEPVETIRVKSRDPQLSRLQTSLAEVPGPRRPDVPLYVLTSLNTGSAAEEFAFVLKNLKRATVVGDRTAGAGHMVAGAPMPHGFVAGISITRVSDPRTGAEWEAVGVQPDRSVPADQALGAAHAMALRAAAAEATDADRRRTLERTAEWVEARDRPRDFDPARLAAIAGRYEGDRVVQIVAGRPMLRRGVNGMAEELVPLADGSFAFGGTTRIGFAPGSPSPLMSVDRADGSRGAYPRLEGSVRD